ncbi:hypothetical protein ACF0H5_009757 [Mactra antiquata]
MKTDLDTLPKISFVSREMRKRKIRMKLEKQHRYHYIGNHDNAQHSACAKKRKGEYESYQSTQMSDVPDLSSDYHSSKPMENKPVRKPLSIKKKRPSVDQLRTQQRAILGDLFPVDQAVVIRATPKNSGKSRHHSSDHKTSTSFQRDRHKTHCKLSRSKSDDVSIHSNVNDKHHNDMERSAKNPLNDNSVHDNDVFRTKHEDNCVPTSFRNDETPTSKYFSSGRKRNESDVSDMGHLDLSPRVNLFDIFENLTENFHDKINNITFSTNDEGAVLLHDGTKDTVIQIDDSSSNDIVISDSASDLNEDIVTVMDRGVMTDLHSSFDCASYTTVSDDIKRTEIKQIETKNYIENYENTQIKMCENEGDGVNQTEKSSDEIILLSDDSESIHDESCDIVDKSCDITDKSCDITDKSCDIADKSCDSTEKSCDITGKSCDITGKSCDITEKSCDITGKSCDITEKSCGITDRTERSVFDLVGNTLLLSELPKCDNKSNEIVSIDSDEDENSAKIAEMVETPDRCRRVSGLSDKTPVLERFFVEFSDEFSHNNDDELPCIEDDYDIDISTTCSNDERDYTSTTKCDNIFSMFSNRSQFSSHSIPSKSSTSTSTTLSTASASVTSMSSTSATFMSPSLSSLSSTSVTSMSSSSSVASSGSSPSTVTSVIAQTSSKCSTSNSSLLLTRRSLKRKRKSSDLHKSKSSTERSLPEIYICGLAELSLPDQMKQLAYYFKDFVNLHKGDATTKYDLPGSYMCFVLCCEYDHGLDIDVALDLVELLSTKYVIPSEICDIIIEKTFNCDIDLSHVHRSYKVLSSLLDGRNGSFHVTWETIEKCLKVTIDNASVIGDIQLLQSTLLLKLYIKMLRCDLYTRNLSDSQSIRNSLGYRMLAYSTSQSNYRDLIYYLNKTLNAGQCMSSNMFHVPDTLTLLQDLFCLSVDVSSSCIDSANGISREMLNTYKYLPTLEDKTKFIQSITSSLLQFKLIQKVLESQYDGYFNLGIGFPESLEDVIQCFFKVIPLMNPFTPPSSPDSMIDISTTRFTSVDTEEIAMLCYYGVVSYLQSSQDKSYRALRMRSNAPSSRTKGFRTDDLQLLQHFTEHVTEFEDHLRGINSEFTPATEQYLMQLEFYEGLESGQLGV